MSATANMQPYFILFNLGGFKCCGLYNSFMHLSLPVAMARDIQFLPLAGVVVGNINVSCKCTASCSSSDHDIIHCFNCVNALHNLHRMIHVAARQDYSHEDDGEPVKSLPSQAEHTVHVGTGRLDAEQKEKMHEAAEEDKQGCHADGSTHGLTTYKTKPLSDSMDDEDSSKEEEDLADSADEEMDSDEDFSEEEDSHEGCSEVRMLHPSESRIAVVSGKHNSDIEGDCQVIREHGIGDEYSDLTVCSSICIVMRTCPALSEALVELHELLQRSCHTVFMTGPGDCFRDCSGGSVLVLLDLCCIISPLNFACCHNTLCCTVTLWHQCTQYPIYTASYTSGMSLIRRGTTPQQHK